MSVAMHPTRATSDHSEFSRVPLTEDLRHDEELSPFTSLERREFAADDSQAGKTIAKILCALFMYPLIVMAIVIWWTMRTLGN